MKHKIPQCEICEKTLYQGYVERRDPLTEEFILVCHECAVNMLELDKLLEEDDLRQHAF